jgi:hypothetical protein
MKLRMSTDNIAVLLGPGGYAFPGSWVSGIDAPVVDCCVISKKPGKPAAAIDASGAFFLSKRNRHQKPQNLVAVGLADESPNSPVRANGKSRRGSRFVLGRT